MLAMLNGCPWGGHPSTWWRLWEFFATTPTTSARPKGWPQGQPLNVSTPLAKNTKLLECSVKCPGRDLHQVDGWPRGHLLSIASSKHLCNYITHRNYDWGCICKCSTKCPSGHHPPGALPIIQKLDLDIGCRAVLLLASPATNIQYRN